MIVFWWKKVTQMNKKETKFRYCKDDKSFEAKHKDKDWNDGLCKDNSFREIAHQLKRIADILENDTQ